MDYLIEHLGDITLGILGFYLSCAFGFILGTVLAAVLHMSGRQG